jgi:hypothetical protein
MNEAGGMVCAEVAELLPWFLNGTLKPSDVQRIRSHLESCPSCRGDLGRTQWASSVFGAHVPAAALVALAWNLPAEGLDLDLCRQHVKSCQACAEELALVRESRELESADEARPAARQLRPALRWGSLAAALAVGFGAGLLSLRLTVHRPAQEARRLAGRVDELDAQVRRLQEAEARLRGEVRRLEAPEINLPIVEALPDSAGPRSQKPPGARVLVPTGARLVAFVLSSGRAAGPAAAELRNPQGEVIWRSSGLQPSRLGGYALALPTSLLKDAEYTITLRPDTGGPETYSVRLERVHP